MKCQIKGCPEQTSYGYEWMQSGKIKGKWKQIKKSLDLCISCHFQLKGEMLKQQAIEELADAIRLEKDWK